MKYIDNYLAEKMKIKVLGELRTIDEEAEPCMIIGQRLVIDDMESDIVVWYADYCKWLETKLANFLSPSDTRKTVKKALILENSNVNTGCIKDL